MDSKIFESKDAMGKAAAAEAIATLRDTLAKRGEANLIVATGASQFEILAHLVQAPDIDWSRVTAFHLDEYVDIPTSHPASFRKYLKERFADSLPAPLKAFHYVNGDTGDPAAECRRLHGIIENHPIDLALVGIGENAHLAFNDPPADFDTDAAYLVVDLDEACRRQQLGEGWFGSLEEVPAQAISMGIRQIMKSRTIIVTCPDTRKAKAVKAVVEGPVTHTVPASILQNHSATTLYLDSASAGLLENKTLQK